MAQTPTKTAPASARLERTIKTGLIGHGIQLSRTPRMHMEEGRAQGLDYRYSLFDTAAMSTVPPLDAMLAEAETNGFSGLNITHPFKQEVLAHLDELSQAAKVVNAVNTVLFHEGRRIGHNTDYWGFSKAFRQSLADAPKARVLLLGAGGAGGAVANALVDDGVQQLSIFDPSQERAQALNRLISSRIGEGRVEVAQNLVEAAAWANGIVNASPIGMAAYPGSPVPADLLRREKWIADIIYFPIETELLATARAKGCRTMDGSGMAVMQAVRAFELFSGLQPNAHRMRATFDAFDVERSETSS